MAGVLDIYRIKHKEAMGLAQIAWEEVMVETIANCWHHTRIVFPCGPDGCLLPTEEPAAPPEDYANDDNLCAAVEWLHILIQELQDHGILPEAHRMEVNKMLSFAAEENTAQELTDKEIIELVQVPEESKAEEEEEEAHVEPAISHYQALESVRALSHYFLQWEEPEFAQAYQLCPPMLCAIHLSVVENMLQTSITDFL
ncbi:hypothetical protein DACRYDRAFT_104121 [Dacryopinax primogenitus]|uniref:DDE-1 domain-containing protein n=1 Tax=Dacryopinax primogenitus (strain DJM 731) TaxID=1858805 RepID=M5GGK3_DACPD|nr:uncharacterized protein DACRYDRAFT_104121 [Dacryopinax primogenitus]EJU05638.1 hypothetical protein DACRYDRAFT_104121 [Dacryopinax primogenitus]